MATKETVKELIVKILNVPVDVVQDDLAVDVGCHGYDHYWWNKLSAKELTYELERSKAFLASLGCDMDSWTACYPYGSYSDEVVAELEKQGCKLAFTTEVRVTEIGKNHSLLIPRLDTNDFPKSASAELNQWYLKG
jgi:peptidoglycan/xylan/chitin deacetylase (PgdA/CDA1 family)